jgi:hypothetical protein
LYGLPDRSRRDSGQGHQRINPLLAESVKRHFAVRSETARVLGDAAGATV